jgi:hypothetical protein
MKLKFVFIILLSLVFILALSPKLSAVSDTLWIKTLQENTIMGDCFFSEDDSLLIVNTHDSKGNYIAFYNSYTGDIIRKLYNGYELGIVTSRAISYKDTLLATASWRKYNVTSGNDYDFNVKFINYKTGQIVDSLPRKSEPELMSDSTSVGYIGFSYDGTKVFTTLSLIESYDTLGKPIYKPALYVWDLATHSVIQKITDYASAKSFQITPNSKYFVKHWYGKRKCISFEDIEKDSTVFEVCEGDSLGEGTVIFPKDTTHFLISYANVSKLYNLNNFAQEKQTYTFTTATLYGSDFAFGSRYIVYKEYFGDFPRQIIVYDLQENQIVYKYAPDLKINGNSGGIKVSNNSQLIFDHHGKDMRMFNAKYTTTSVKEPDKDEPQLIYPNPTNGDITLPLNSENTEQITISDINGNEIETIKVNYASNSFIYNSSKLSPGTYIVNLRLSNKIKSFKFIVNR